MANKRPEFQVYNSMTKQKEIFKPIVEGKVGMYICGVTSYDLSHIGHARAYVAFDVLYRYLKYLGYEVVYVRNFTDVDDKIIRRANEVGEDPKALSGRFCQEFLNDMADLQCLLPTHQPRVTDHMQQIKDMIAQIISNGCAYAVDGDVYFSVDNFPKYGLLSGRKLEDNRAGERVAVDDRKRNPADFALWKAAKPGEPLWDSPWGPGRPGWHIECSAMSAHYLTHAFDIHGGGMDLIFPHHENEIAQSCAACSKSKVNYWIHNGFVTANDEKMSKSLGNFFTIREVTKFYHPLALRHFLLGTHYRSPVNYSISQIEISSEAVFYIYQTLQDCEDAVSALKEESATNAKVRVSPAGQECISKLHNEFEKKQQKLQQLSTIKSLVDLRKQVREVLDVLGLLPSLSYAEVLQQLKDKALKRAGLTEAEILRAIEERMQARKNKEFSRSDQIRSDLAAKGIALMDVGKETVWRPCVPVQQEQTSTPAQQEKPGVPGEQQNPPPTEEPQSVIPADKQQLITS
ncbi:UNVERIFIED_CONTAM: Cysteine--tRNA ligase CPS1, chloroplastic/mitochondrial [Sesamum radiatum]|uniref:cysteine--tRNA ligase n=1 Tax=Sesamum radiatum TaxID=300843 RepID=A0AAW2V929_SESRA